MTDGGATSEYARPLDLHRALVRLKREYDANVRPVIARHQYYVGPGERRRLKARSARKRLRKAARKRREAEVERLRRVGPESRD